MFPSNKTNNSLTKTPGISASSSPYGEVIPYCAGLVQTGSKLTWYNGWRGWSFDVNPLLTALTGTSSGAGKKAGKASKKSNTTYYSAKTDSVLCVAPASGCLSAWYNNQKFYCVIVGASGFISTATDGSGNGSFTFAANFHDSLTTYTGTVPGSSPYQVAAPNFVADVNLVFVNGQRLQPAAPGFPPGIGAYTVTSAGVYTFNAAQAGGTLLIWYRQITSGGTSALAGIVSVVVHDPYSASFNDYGAPAPVNVNGTWETPCWNAWYPVPGRIDSGAFRARDPYSWWTGDVTSSGATLNFPAALIGKPVTVYYGIPQILNSAGVFFSSQHTPMQILNAEFEPRYGEGAEYAAHPGQQVILNYCCGIGNTNEDLGAANARANVNYEVIGSFTQWPNGDASLPDIATDLLMSGPTLIPFETAKTTASTFTSTNTGDSGPPNYGDRNVTNTGGTLWIQHSSGLDNARWQIVWTGFGSGTAGMGTGTETAFVTFDLATPYGTVYFSELVISDATHASNVVSMVGTGQQFDISGWDLSTLQVKMDVYRTLSDNTYVEISLANLAVSITSAPLTLNTVGHGCNLNAYAGTPVPGRGVLLGDISAWKNYCGANVITGVANLRSQRAMKDVLDEILVATNSVGVLSGGLLNIIPRDEVSAAGNGCTYTAPTASGPSCDFTDNDYVANGNKPFLTFSPPDPVQRDNTYAAQFSDRTIDYADNVLPQVDQMSVALYGPRRSGALDTAAIGIRPSSGTQSLTCIADPAIMQKVCNVQARRSATALPTVKFELDRQYFFREAMDFVTVSDSRLGINKMPVRLLKAERTEKRTVQCEAEPYIYGLNHPIENTVPQTTGSLQKGNVAVTSVNAPIIFEPTPATLAAEGVSVPQIAFIVSDSDPNYGGCAIYLSDDDGTSYRQIGSMGACTTGVLTADYPVGSDPDTAHSLALNLGESLGQLSSLSSTQADAIVEPCYIASASGFEIVSPSAATPTGSYTCTLGTYIRRGIYGTTIADHPIGSRFGVTTGAFRWNLPAAYVGQTLYFKFAAANSTGGQLQDLSTCTAYSYTPAGTGVLPTFLVNGS